MTSRLIKFTNHIFFFFSFQNVILGFPFFRSQFLITDLLKNKSPTHIKVHEDGVVLSGVLLGSGNSLSGNGSVRKTHQDLGSEALWSSKQMCLDCLEFSWFISGVLHFTSGMTTSPKVRPKSTRFMPYIQRRKMK